MLKTPVQQFIEKRIAGIAAKLYVEGLRYRTYTEEKAKEILSHTVMPVGNKKMIDMYSKEIRKELKSVISSGK